MNGTDLRNLLCKCCGGGKEIITIKLIRHLAALSKEFGGGLVVHCGYRCPKHNAEEGGKPDSQHLRGLAADFHIDGLRRPDDLVRIRDAMLRMGFTGVGLYECGELGGWIHGDVRPLAEGEGPHLWKG